MAQRVATPAGKRLLRAVCGPDYGAIAVTEYTAPIQAEILRSVGMPAMAKTADAVAIRRQASTRRRADLRRQGDDVEP